MAKWYEGAEEAAFKPTAGGYVFQPPSLLWPFVRPRGFVVDAAQKAVLAALLRRQRRLILLVVVAYVLIGLALGVAIAMLAVAQRLSPAELVAVAAVTVLAVIPIVIAPHLYLVRAMRPLLANLPRTDERITVSEQLQSLAGAISVKLLWLGGIGGVMMIIGNIANLAEVISEGRAGSRLYGPLFGLLIGALLTSYFVYLAVLRSRLNRRPN
jgi:hypothetical protein